MWGFDTEAIKVLQAMQHFDLDRGGGSVSTATSRNSFATAPVESNKYQKLFRERVMEEREEEGEGQGEGSCPAPEDVSQQNTQGVSLKQSPDL